MFDHEYDRYRTDSDLERQQHDETRARWALYPPPRNATRAAPVHPSVICANCGWEGHTSSREACPSCDLHNLLTESDVA